MTTKHYLELSREEKNRLADEKMACMKKKNAEVMKRHQEVEEDKRNAEVMSKSAATNKKVDLPPPPDPTFNFLADRSRDACYFSEDRHQGSRRHHLNYGGQDFENVRHAIQQKKKFEKEHPDDPPRNKMEMTLTMTGKARQEYAKWKAEREQIDNERVIRQKTSCGQWKREWDNDKITQEEDPVEYSPQFYRSVPWESKDFQRRNTNRSFGSAKGRLAYSAGDTQTDSEFKSDNSNIRSVIADDNVIISVKYNSKNCVDKNKQVEYKNHANDEIDLKEKNGDLLDNKSCIYKYSEKGRHKESCQKQFENFDEINDPRKHQKFQKSLNDPGGIWGEVSDAKYKSEQPPHHNFDSKIGWEGNASQSQFKEKHFDKGYRLHRERNECFNNIGNTVGNHKESFNNRFEERENICTGSGGNRNFLNHKDGSKNWLEGASVNDKRLSDNCNGRDMENKRQGRWEQTVKREHRGQDDEKNYRGINKYYNKYSKGWEQNEIECKLPAWKNQNKTREFKETYNGPLIKGSCGEKYTNEFREKEKVKHYGVQERDGSIKNELIHNKIKRRNNEQEHVPGTYNDFISDNQYQKYKNDKTLMNKNKHYNSVNLQNERSQTFKNEKRNKGINRQYSRDRENHGAGSFSEKSSKNNFAVDQKNGNTHARDLIGGWDDDSMDKAKSAKDGWDDEPMNDASKDGWEDEPLKKVTKDGWDNMPVIKAAKGEWVDESLNKTAKDGWDDESLNKGRKDGWDHEPVNKTVKESKVVSFCDNKPVHKTVKKKDTGNWNEDVYNEEKMTLGWNDEKKKLISGSVDESLRSMRKKSTVELIDEPKSEEEVDMCPDQAGSSEIKKSVKKLENEPLPKTAPKQMPKKSVAKQKQLLPECGILANNASSKQAIQLTESALEQNKNSINERQSEISQDITITENLNKDVNFKNVTVKDINCGSLNDGYNLSHDSDSWESFTASHESFSEQSEDTEKQDIGENDIRSCPDNMVENGMEKDYLNFSLSKLVINNNKDNAGSKYINKTENVEAWIKEVQESNSSFNNSPIHINKTLTESSENAGEDHPKILEVSEKAITYMDNSAMNYNDGTNTLCSDESFSVEIPKSDSLPANVSEEMHGNNANRMECSVQPAIENCVTEVNPLCENKIVLAESSDLHPEILSNAKVHEKACDNMHTISAEYDNIDITACSDETFPIERSKSDSLSVSVAVMAIDEKINTGSDRMECSVQLVVEDSLQESNPLYENTMFLTEPSEQTYKGKPEILAGTEVSEKICVSRICDEINIDDRMRCSVQLIVENSVTEAHPLIENTLSLTEPSEQSYEDHSEILADTEVREKIFDSTYIDDSPAHCNSTNAVCSDKIFSSEIPKSDSLAANVEEIDEELKIDGVKMECLKSSVIENSCTEVTLEKGNEEMQSLDKKSPGDCCFGYDIEDSKVEKSSSELPQHINKNLPESNITLNADECVSSTSLDCKENLVIENSDGKIFSHGDITSLETEELNCETLQTNSVSDIFFPDSSKGDLDDELKHCKHSKVNFSVNELHILPHTCKEITEFDSSIETEAGSCCHKTHENS